MFTQQNLYREAHQKIDHIFKSLFPKYGMAERTEQIRLAHRMLDAMLNNQIALSDAGTGIGKTYAYLVAGTLFLRYRAACKLAFRPIIISTSSIALQSAVKDEYLPFLSELMMENGFTNRPIRAVIRKGKSRYVCDRRLKRRLNRIDFSKKNPAAAAALRSLCKCLDMDEAQHLSKYDRERICVPKACDCNDPDCRYRRFLEHCDTGRYPFQICNHNLFLAAPSTEAMDAGPFFLMAVLSLWMRRTNFPKRRVRCSERFWSQTLFGSLLPLCGKNGSYMTLKRWQNSLPPC